MADLQISMTFLTPEEIRILRQAVEKEFPYDSALQEIHLARRIIKKEAETIGTDFFIYIKELSNKIRKTSNVENKRG